MKNSLNNEERSRLDKDIADAEKRTGAQIVLAVIERSDSYPELPWKLFALGASIAGLLVLIMNVSWPLISTATAVLLVIVMILSAGAGLALLSILVPDFACLFLHVHRAEVETRQYAESLFLNREMFATSQRRAVLLLVSLFERRVVVLPDSGLKEKLNQQTIENIIRLMRPHLLTGQTARALETGLKELDTILCDGVQPQSFMNELPDEINEEKGA